MRFGLKAAGRTLLLLAAFLVLSGVTLEAQSWNRAVFRGDEIDPRDFEFNKEYFLNLTSYRVAPDWEELHKANDRAYLVNVGSVRSDEFYLYQDLKVHLDVNEKARFHFDFLQHEDFDTRFLRNRVGLVFPLHENWSAFASGEGTSFKEDNDIGAGVIYRRGLHDWWELQITAVDFSERKGKNDRRFSKDPYGLLLRNEIPLSDKIFIGTGVELQLPMTLVDPGEDLEFHFDKGLCDAYVRWRLGETEEVRFFVAAEETEKQTEYESTPIDDQKLSRHSFRGGAEYYWRSDVPIEADYHVGCHYFHFRERSLFPGESVEDERHRRDESTVYGGLAIEIMDDVFLRPALYVDYVSQIELFNNNPRRNDRYHGIQSKLSGLVEIRFEDTIRLTINPNLDVDQMNWGGGNIQFIAIF